MRINTCRKGYTKEKLAADELEKDGWIVEFRSQRIRFGRIDLGYRPTREERKHLDYPKNLELWKRAKFDIEAIRAGHILRVSVKNSVSSSYVQEQTNISEYRKQHWLPNSIYTELWIWHKAKWFGRGKNKQWVKEHWGKIRIT